MRKRAWIAIPIIILVILTVGPLLTGFLIQRDYDKLITFYNADNQIRIKILHYQRGWLSSDARFNLEIKSPQFAEVFRKLAIADDAIPKNYTFNLHIQHGPIIYRPLGNSFSIFGLAASQNFLEITPEVQKFFKLIGVDAHFIEANNDFVTFTGKFIKYLKLNSMTVTYPNTHLNLQIKNLDSQFLIVPKQQQVNGNIQLNNISLQDANHAILIPSLTLKFDQYATIKNWWLGKNSLLIPQITYTELNKKLFTIVGVNFAGHAEEKGGMLNAVRKFAIEKIELADHDSFGPLHLQLSINQLNDDAIVDLIAAYRYIMQRGELYESQLHHKMYMMLPNVINPGSVISFDQFNFSAPEGQLSMNARFAWDTNTPSLPDDLVELIQAAQAKINLRISKNLTDKLISFFSGLPFMTQAESQPNQTESANIQGLHELLNQWIKAGYIKPDHDDYIISIVQSQGKLQINNVNISN